MWITEGWTGFWKQSGSCSLFVWCLRIYHNFTNNKWINLNVMMHSWFFFLKNWFCRLTAYAVNAILLVMPCHTFMERLQHHSHNEYLKNCTELGDDQTREGKTPTLSTTWSSRLCRNTCTQAALTVNNFDLQFLVVWMVVSAALKVTIPDGNNVTGSSSSYLRHFDEVTWRPSVTPNIQQFLAVP